MKTIHFPVLLNGSPFVAVAFQTGRQYTEEGQRIFAVQLDDRILMIDVDRMIYYAFREVEFNPRSILEAYDCNQGGMEFSEDMTVFRDSVTHLLAGDLTNEL